MQAAFEEFDRSSSGCAGQCRDVDGSAITRRAGRILPLLRPMRGSERPDSIVNHPANLTPLLRSTHQSLHNEFGVVERWLHGTPSWAKAAESSLVGGTIGSIFSDDNGLLEMK